MIYSSTANRVTPNSVRTINCTGLTFPSKAPYAIRQPATQKSALMRLSKKKYFKFYCIYRMINLHQKNVSHRTPK